MHEERLAVLDLIQNDAIAAADGRRILELFAATTYTDHPQLTQLRLLVLHQLGRRQLNTSNCLEVLQLLIGVNLGEGEIATQRLEELQQMIGLMEADSADPRTAISLLRTMVTLFNTEESKSGHLERLEILLLVQRGKITATTAVELMQALLPLSPQPAMTEKVPHLPRPAIPPIISHSWDGVGRTRDRMREEALRVREEARRSRDKDKEEARSRREQEKEAAQRAHADARHLRNRDREESRSRHDREGHRERMTRQTTSGLGVPSMLRQTIQNEVETALRQTQQIFSRENTPIFNSRRENLTPLDAAMNNLHDALKALDISLNSTEELWSSINRTDSQNSELGRGIQKMNAALSVVHQRMAEVSEAKASLEILTAQAAPEEQPYPQELVAHTVILYERHLARLNEISTGVAELQTMVPENEFTS
ncbi:MAG: hypothetical protein FWF06_07490 [Symbiobacteriaceae bacterium]|nr:hypothetical protein [Symbiobacteriaceae bacterium]